MGVLSPPYQDIESELWFSVEQSSDPDTLRASMQSKFASRLRECLPDAVLCLKAAGKKVGKEVSQQVKALEDSATPGQVRQCAVKLWAESKIQWAHSQLDQDPDLQTVDKYILDNLSTIFSETWK